MRYALRDEKGIIKASLSASAAKAMMDLAPGEFKRIEYKTGKKTVFEFNADWYVSTRGEDICLYAFKGERLVPLEIERSSYRPGKLKHWLPN